MWQIIARDILRNFVFYFFSFNFCLRFVIFSFLYARLETGHIMWLGMAGGHPHRFPHKNFSSVYWIFTKLGHMIPLWKGKNPIYFGVIRSKVKVTITINRIFDNRVVSTITLVLYIGSLPNLTTWLPCGRERTLFILGSLGQRSRSRSPLL